MKYCSNCNATLKESAKFCTNCGMPNEDKSAASTTNDTFQQLEGDKPTSPSKGTKIIVGLIAVVALFFIVRSLVTNIDISRNSLSVSKALTKIEGDWHDPTGALLGDKDAIITFRKRAEDIIGEDTNKTLYIALLAYSTNTYGGLVAINDDNENYTVQYDQDEEKLLFLGNLTKREWYIQRVNTKK